MPWKARTTMSQRSEFVEQAEQEGANISRLCAEYGISRKTGYKWLKRYRAAGESGLQDGSRRPHQSPNRTPIEQEELILRAREQHPAWGGRKLYHFLRQQGQAAVPAPSTIQAILQRHGCIEEQEGVKHRRYCRFERAAANDLWQMDYKGDIHLDDGTTCYPLTILDDHSRYVVDVQVCLDHAGTSLQPLLTACFQAYGLPTAMLMDNGAPWGHTQQRPFTVLATWLMRLGIQVLHGRPAHPQTQGKVERVHRTQVAELFAQHSLPCLAACQAALQHWRHEYNTLRPHEALQHQPPARHYTPSSRPFPDPLPPLVYPANDCVRKVDKNGRISFHGRSCPVSAALRGYPVAVRPDPLCADVFEVFFVNTRVQVLDFHSVHYPLS